MRACIIVLRTGASSLSMRDCPDLPPTFPSLSISLPLPPLLPLFPLLPLLTLFPPISPASLPRFTDSFLPPSSTSAGTEADFVYHWQPTAKNRPEESLEREGRKEGGREGGGGEGRKGGRADAMQRTKTLEKSKWDFKKRKDKNGGERRW